jgi:hypothetical protein
VKRAVDIFYQTIVSENGEISSGGRALEFSSESLNSFFSFADNALNQMEIVDLAYQEDVKVKLQKGLEYVLRGSLTNVPAGDSPVTLQGSSVSISATKINVGGMATNVTASFTSYEGIIIRLIT